MNIIELNFNEINTIAGGKDNKKKSAAANSWGKREWIDLGITATVAMSSAFLFSEKANQIETELARFVNRHIINSIAIFSTIASITTILSCSGIGYIFSDIYNRVVY